MSSSTAELVLAEPLANVQSAVYVAKPIILRPKRKASAAFGIGFSDLILVIDLLPFIVAVLMIIGFGLAIVPLVSKGFPVFVSQSVLAAPAPAAHAGGGS